MEAKMDFNLILDRWIPVRRRDGMQELIAPWGITDGHESNPVILLNAPRPDFNGSLIQFLIGLIQTAAAPEDEEEWEDLFDKPPSPDDLKEKFQKVQHAFDLGGQGARFMQDIDNLTGKDRSIGSLLIDAPGEHTLKKNTDHFVKRDLAKKICPFCCSAALYTLQTNAPRGGVGHRTSLRGGGPLTTLVLSHAGSGNSLWHTIWLNVLERDTFLRTYGNSGKTSEADIFPWLAPTRTSEKGGITTPADVHPLQMYWGMPRRIRLNLEDISGGSCDICGLFSGKLISSYRTKNYGINYDGPWLHTLTPYGRDKNSAPFPIHAQPGGVTYRHWLGFVQEDDKLNREPAKVVHIFRSKRHRRNWQFRLWAFGYDMEIMKARCWYEGAMPLFPLEEVIRAKFEHAVAGMVRAASAVAHNLRRCVKDAWFKRPEDVKGDIGFIDNLFWQTTEPDFYSSLSGLKTLLEHGQEALPIAKSWHDCLCRTSLKLFDKLAWDGPIEDADPKRVVLARQQLIKLNYGKKIKMDLLHIT